MKSTLYRIVMYLNVLEDASGFFFFCKQLQTVIYMCFEGAIVFSFSGDYLIIGL